MPVREASTGPVTYLLTDVAASTVRWEQEPEAMAAAMVRHDEVVEAAVGRFGGDLLRPRGEGDSRFAVFPGPAQALPAAAEVVRGLAAEAWPTAQPLAVRVAVHTGEAGPAAGHYGPAANRAARLRSVAHPGQVLVSGAAARGALAEGLGLRDLGRHRLADLVEPEHVYQLVGPGLEGDFPPLASLDGVRHNLPTQSDEFVGRELERAHLAKALEASRLVTLTGPGGTGKTRLAVQVAAEQVAAHPEGVWLVELGAVGEGAMVPAAMARALGVPLGPGRAPAEAVEDFLRAKAALVVLDNCEHLAAACAQFVARLLGAAPRLRVLATSRRPLGVAGEQLWPLGPLDHPDPTRLPPLEELGAYEAVALFAARARTALPGFALDAATAPAVAEVCARLDGIPLAIELAAARLRSLAPAELAERLGDRFRLLAGPAGGARRSLRATLDWSWDLLAHPHRLALRRLAAFAGTFDLEAAEAVAAGGELEAAQVLDTLVELVDASLVVPSHGPATRYRLLETVRAYAEEQLVGAGEQEAVRDRHLAWYADVFEAAERASPELWSRKRADRFDVELDNLRAALAWSQAAHRLDGLRLAGLLWPFSWVRGHLPEAAAILEASLAAFPGAPPALRARAHAGLGFLLGLSSREAARPHLEATLALADEGGMHEWWVYFSIAGLAVAIGGPEGEEVAQRGLEAATARGFPPNKFPQALGQLAEARGDLEAALEWYERGASEQRAKGPGPARNRILSNLAQVLEKLGDREKAEALWKESLEGALDLSDAIMETLTRRELGRIALERGDLAAAEEHLRRANSLARDTGLVDSVISSVAGLADAAARGGDLAGARKLAGDLVEELRARSHPELARALVVYGRLAILAGDAAEGDRTTSEAVRLLRAGEQVCWDCFSEAIVALTEAGGDGPAHARELIAEAVRRDAAPAAVAAGIEGLAEVVATTGASARAARLLGTARALLAGSGRPPARSVALEERLRRSLGDEAFLAALAEGGVCDVQAALLSALERG